MNSMQELMIKCVNTAQQSICDALGNINQKFCVSHPWSSKELNGGGQANIFTNGQVLEKGAVNVSTVRGKVFGQMLQLLPSKEQKIDPDKYRYFATGISIILHPYSPMVPTIHANYRYFEIKDENEQVISWFFGGGTDLTPYYLFEEDAIHFHQILKDTCDQSEKGLYEKLKKEADAYFYLPHRKEHRGIGGIFSLRMHDRSPEQIYEWVSNCCNAFIEGYIPIIKRRINNPYTEAQKKWQLIRRGRYVEFNLLYDIGTTFGIKSGGIIENILVSLPPHICWEYDFQPEAGSPEEKLLIALRTPRQWI